MALAQEVVAVEAGFADWPELERASADTMKTPCPDLDAPMMKSAVLILFVSDVSAALFEEVRLRKADFPQSLTKQAWGGTDFHVRDPDGNVIAFVQYG